MGFIDIIFYFVITPIWILVSINNIIYYYKARKTRVLDNRIDHDNDWVVNDEIQRQWDEMKEKEKEK